ncbi:hypothetical protein FOA52_003300 [Chlamydomonas sp. UWO 241]|nr:hypothetical protein FOA52_003300 [Chlamydomonas sp. UWO 241]
MMTSAPGLAIAGPNAGCSPYFDRVDQRGKEALRGLQDGLRRFNEAQVTPPSCYAKPSLCGCEPGGQLGPGDALGMSLALMREVKLHVPVGFTTHDVARHIVAPLATPARAAMADLPGLIPERQTGPATVYAIHTWDDPFADTVDALLAHLSPGDSNGSQRVYLDLLCANLTDRSPSLVRAKGVRAQIRHAQSTVIVISSLSALRRSWLLYQIWCVARERREDRMTLLLGPGVSGADVKAAAKGGSLRYSTAGSQADKDAIIAEVIAAGRTDARLRSSGGAPGADVYAAFDAAVTRALSDAVARACPGDPTTPRVPAAAHAPRPLPPPAANAPTAPTTLFGMGPSSGRAPIALRDMPELIAPPRPLLDALLAHGEGGLDVLRAARSKFRCNGERLGGMMAQFDGADRGSLTASQLSECLEFFVEGVDLEGAADAAACVAASAGGRVNEDNLLSAIQVVLQSAADAAPSTRGGAEPGDKGRTSHAVVSVSALGWQAPASDGLSDEPPPFAILGLPKGGGAPHVAPVPPPSTALPANIMANLIAGPEIGDAEDAAEAALASIGPVPDVPYDDEGEPSVLKGDAIDVLMQLRHIVFPNAERLVGMIDQFDEGEKGYLVEGEMAEFVEFFCESTPMSLATAVARCLCLMTESGTMDWDNMHPTVEAACRNHKPKPAGAAAKAEEQEAGSSGQPAPSTALPSNIMANLMAGPEIGDAEDAAEAALGPVPDVPYDDEGEPSVLKGDAIDVLMHLRHIVFPNAERLVGMIDQFDVGEKGYLVEGEMAEFVEFFCESIPMSLATAVARCLCLMTESGTVDWDNMHPTVEAACRNHKPKSAGAAAKAEVQEAGASGQPAPSTALPANIMANLMAGPEIGDAEDAAEAALALIGPVPDVPYDDEGEPSVLKGDAIDVLMQLRHIVFPNAERLVGMIDQFDEGDKGYLVEGEMAEFVEFFCESTPMSLATAVARCLCLMTESGTIDWDNLHPTVEAACRAHKQKHESRS